MLYYSLSMDFWDGCHVQTCVFGCLLQFYKQNFAIENVRLFLVRLCGNVSLFFANTTRELPQEGRVETVNRFMDRGFMLMCVLLSLCVIK